MKIQAVQHTQRNRNDKSLGHLVKYKNCMVSSDHTDSVSKQNGIAFTTLRYLLFPTMTFEARGYRSLRRACRAWMHFFARGPTLNRNVCDASDELEMFLKRRQS